MMQSGGKKKTREQVTADIFLIFFFFFACTFLRIRSLNSLKIPSFIQLLKVLVSFNFETDHKVDSHGEKWEGQNEDLTIMKRVCPPGS